jgi:hypothetical protein
MTARQILFGQSLSWMPLIAERLDPTAYAGSFAPLDHVDLEAFEAVLPLRLGDYATLARRPDLLGRRFLCPSAKTAALCDDKFALARFLTDQGFGRYIPAVGLVGSVPAPLVRRPRRDEFGQNARIVLGDGQDATPVDQEKALFDQAYVPGADEYVLHVIRHGRRIRFAWALAHRMSGPHLIRGATNVPVESREIDPRPALAVFEPMLAALDYAGTCCIDFKMVGDTPRLLEINPRFGGSLTLGINAYVGAYLDCLSR